MIYEISLIKKHHKLKDFCWVEVTRQEPEINNNQVYVQKVMGSYSSVRWFRNNLVLKKNCQNQK